jgi:hypothetical protein
MGRIHSPCKGCEKRQLKCHATCQQYIDYANAISTERENAYKERLLNMQLFEMQQTGMYQSRYERRPEPLRHKRTTRK